MTKRELITLLEELPTPDASQVLVCDIQNDDDEKFHFENIDSLDILAIKGNVHSVICINR